MSKYYSLVANNNGSIETIFGSFDKLDCIFEMDAEKAQLKEQGYTGFKIVSNEVDESPDRDIYSDDFCDVYAHQFGGAQ